MDMKDMFELWYGVKVKFYPYRTAHITDVVFVINRMSDEGRKFEAALAEAAHAKTDNHTLYAVSNRNGTKTMYIACSDFKMYVGLGMEEAHW